MKDKAKLSVVISAYNEEAKIRDCLESASFADQIILVDNQSTDRTVVIGKELAATVISRVNNLMLNINKNFGFSKAKHEWILSLDADERVTPELEKKVQEIVSKNSQIAGYWIPRKNIIFGKWVKGEMWWPDYQLRLFRKNKGRFPEKHVHEYIALEGSSEKIAEPILHLNYSSISQFLYKLDKIYTENEAEQLLKKGYTASWVDALRFPIRDFLKTFFAQKGYKDGLHGLVLSLLQAFYALVVFAKAWEKLGFKEYNDKRFLRLFQKEASALRKESQYWIYTSLLHETRNPFKKLQYFLLRKAVKKTSL